MSSVFSYIYSFIVGKRRKNVSQIILMFSAPGGAEATVTYLITLSLVVTVMYYRNAGGGEGGAVTEG